MMTDKKGFSIPLNSSVTIRNNLTGVSTLKIDTRREMFLKFYVDFVSKGLSTGFIEVGSIEIKANPD